MNNDVYAARFAALGHVVRLAIFQLLVKSGHGGMTVGQISEALEIPASTLSFHLRELVASELVTQSRDGRSVNCEANFAALDQLLKFVKTDCCKGVRLAAFAR
ncbi:MAG: metalloregulator ArsR/SmtB family transcription factor [Pseudomonadota bacterium]